MTTYVVTLSLFGKVRRHDVWAASPADARRKAAAIFEAAEIISVEKRKAF